MVTERSLPKTALEGIVLLQNVGNQEFVDLPNGNWDDGQMQTWHRYDRPHDHGFMNQLWMVVPVPSEPGAYHIFNLFYGCFMGVYLDERNSFHEVRCNPCSMTSSSIKWRTIPSGLHTTFTWALNPERKLDIELGDRPNTLRANLGDTGVKQRWIMHDGNHLITPGPEDTRARWMSLVPGNMILNTLNIPATHQSLALHAKASQGEDNPTSYNPSPLDNPRCQNRSPYEQLCSGIRCLDCRLDVWTSTSGEETCLYAYHGSGILLYAEEGYTLAATLHSVKFFLEKNPTETVMVRVRNETRSPGFFDAFLHDYDVFDPDRRNPLFFNTGRRCMNEITLNEARGRMIILFLDVAGPRHLQYGADEGTFWGPRGSTYLEEEPWQNPDTKVPLNERFLDQARKDTDLTRVRRMGWNISTYLWNPWVWFFRHHKDISQIMSREKVGVDGQYRIGLVDFDFYEQVQDAVDNLIMSNRGCGKLRL